MGKEIVIVNDVKSLIKEMEEDNKREFYEVHGFDKIENMCDVGVCSNKANFIWDVPLLLRIKRFFNGENYQGVKYCKGCLDRMCKVLKTPRKYWREIS